MAHVKETSVSRTNTLEEWRQKTNKISYDLGSLYELDSNFTDSVQEFTATEGQTNFFLDTLELAIASEEQVDNIAGSIILLGDATVDAGFTADERIFQGTAGSETWEATIVAVTDRKIIVENSTGTFSASEDVILTDDNNIVLAAADISSIISESYGVPYCTVYVNDVEQEQGMTTTGFHAPSYDSRIVLAGSPTIPDSFVEGVTIYQGTIGSETWVATILYADDTGIHIKSTSSGTFSPSVMVKVGSGDIDNRILAANLSTMVQIDSEHKYMVELHTPASADDTVTLKFFNAVLGLNELQDDIGVVENLTTSATNLTGAVNELDAEIGNTSEFSAVAGSNNTVSTAIKTLHDEVGDITALDTLISATTLVGASNELQTDIGDVSALTTTNETVVTAINELQTEIGDIAELDTDEKTSLVGAVNELHGEIGTNTTNIATLTTIVEPTQEFANWFDSTTIMDGINELSDEKFDLTSTSDQTINSNVVFTTDNTLTIPEGAILDVSAGTLLIGGGEGSSLSFDTAFIDLNSTSQLEGININRSKIVGNATGEGNEGEAAGYQPTIDAKIQWNEGLVGTGAGNESHRAWQVVGFTNDEEPAIFTSSIVTFYNAKDLVSNNTETNITVGWDATDQNFNFALNDDISLTSITTSGDIDIGSDITITAFVDEIIEEGQDPIPAVPGSISAPSITASGNIGAATMTTSGTFAATGNVTVGSDITITASTDGGTPTAGSISAPSITASGDITAANITASGNVGAATMSSDGDITIGSDITITAFVDEIIEEGQDTIPAVPGSMTVPSITASGDITAATMTTSGDVTIGGDLTVNGLVTTVNTETVTIADNIIVLNSNEEEVPTQDAGIEVERGSSTNVALAWDESEDRWTFTNDGATYYNIPVPNEYDNYTSWTIKDGDSTTYTITSGDTLQIAEGDGIDSNFTADDILTITNTDRGSSQNIFKNVAVSGQSTIVADSNNDTLNVAAGNAMTLTTDAGTDTLTIAHSDTSTQASVNNSNGSVIQDIGLDTFGHLTSITSVDLDDRYLELAGGTLTGEVNASDISFADTKKAKFGTGDDFQIYHDATDTIMEKPAAGAGILKYQASVDGVAPVILEIENTADNATASSFIQFKHSNSTSLNSLKVGSIQNAFFVLNDDDSSTQIAAIAHGAVSLYHDGALKLTTTSGGVDISGDLDVTGDLAVDTNTLFVNHVTGRVGIGTVSPTAKLDVAGNAKVSGAINVGSAINETVYILTGTELDPDNGTIQTKTLTANTTFTESLTTGQSMTLAIEDGTDYTVTWPTIIWATDGGDAPALNTTGYTTIQLWKIGTTLYGARVGDA